MSSRTAEPSAALESRESPTATPSVAYLVAQYPSAYTPYLVREVRGLRARGLDVRVVSIRPPDRPAEALTPEDRDEARHTFFVKPRGPLGALRPHLTTLATRPLGYARGLACAARYGGFDARRLLFGLLYFAEAVVVGHFMSRRGITHAHVHFASSVGMILSRIFPVTVSATFHGPTDFDDAVGHRLAEKLAAASFARVISSYTRAQLMRVCPPTEWGKIHVVPLGTDTEFFLAGGRRKGGPVTEVLCIGRLVAAKGHFTLIDAFARLVGAGRRVRLRLVGDGPERAALEREVVVRGLRDHVVFEGALSQSGVRAAYRAADIFVLASLAEGLPVALVDAMSAELACVATYVSGIPEVVRDDAEGLLVPASDSDALERALMRLVDDPALRQRLGRAARQRVIEHYEIGRHLDRLATLLCLSVGGGRVGGSATPAPELAPAELPPAYVTPVAASPTVRLRASERATSAGAGAAS